MDQRFVRTFFARVQPSITHRPSTNGRLLSELGAYLLSPEQAPAGTKRLSHLLRSQRWTHKLIERFLGVQATLGRDELAQEAARLVWDARVWGNPESIATEGGCALRLSQAARLKRIKKGLYNPPGRPIVVPGMNWLGVVLVGMKTQPC